MLDTESHGHGRWCAEVVEALGLLREGAPRPLHMGVSLGGALLLDLAVVRPEAIGGAALICPGSLHPGGSAQLAGVTHCAILHCTRPMRARQCRPAQVP